MAFTKEQIANQALLLIGADTLASFEDDTREAALVKARWDVVRLKLLSIHPWRFAMVQTQLSRVDGETPLFDKAYIYLFPTDPEPVTLFRSDTPQLDYLIYEDRIYSDATELKLEYVADVETPKMPAYFIDALVHALAVDLAASLADDINKSEIFDRRARVALSAARSIDSKAQPNITVEPVNYYILNQRA
jgi:hypothetical protein